MFGYSQYKPKEFLVVLIALHMSSQLGSDVSEIGSMPSNAVRGSGRGLGSAAAGGVSKFAASFKQHDQLH